jgi:hypothetical protein
MVLSRVRVADQWDLDIYYLGAVADRSGLTPYDPSNLTAMAGGTVQYLFPYMYPPPTVSLFKPLAMLSLGSAKIVWMVMKLAALAALISLWQSKFIPRRDWLAWVLFLAFAFNSVIVRDIRSGNAGLFEEVVIWSALAAYLARRYGLFCGLVLVAAFFKLTPLLLLGLIFLAPVRNRLRYLGFSLAIFAVALGLSWLSTPAEFMRWVTNVSHHDEELGSRNPCTLAFFRQIAGYVGSPDTAAEWKRNADVLYLAVAGGIGWLTLRALWRTRKVPMTEDRQKLVLFFALTAYALMLPRFMSYSYALLLVPAFFVAVRHRRALVVTLALFLAHDVLDKLLGIEWIGENDPFWSRASPLLLNSIWVGYLIVNYFLVFMTLGIWAMYRREIERVEHAESLIAEPRHALAE